MGKVYLIGAGPGDAELITVKGLKYITECDAIVYDRLIPEELLDIASTSCEKICVGKDVGHNEWPQEKINSLLEKLEKKHDKVVRLKGGDPFVFGRGGEEIEYLTKQGICYEVVPGVTSAVAVPECAGIPVTHRGVSRSFHVITGHTKNSNLLPEYDYKNIAKMEGTIIFLMGLAHIEEITEKLILERKPADTPVAVISDGTMPGQKIVRGVLATIAREVQTANVSSPAVIVIGETANYEFSLNNNLTKVGVVATNLLWNKLKKEIEDIHMRPVRLVNMEIEKTEQIERLKNAICHLKEYAWVIFTSQNSVRIFFEILSEEKIDIRRLSHLKFAAIGSGTARKLIEFGIHADFIPTEYNVKTLAEEFVRHITYGERVLLPRAVQADTSLVDILEENGIFCDEFLIYDVKGRATKDMDLLDKTDYLVFVSASGVSAFFDELENKGLLLPCHIKTICIGHVTKKKFMERCNRNCSLAAVSDVSGLILELKTEVMNNGKNEKITS